jgi:hypothetical protein
MKLKTLFYSNGYNKHLPILLKSLENKNYDYSFIGHNTKFINFGSKLRAVQDYIQYYLDFTYTHVLVLDAYDLILLKNNEDLIFKYLNNFNENDIVFSAETNCYPDKDLENVYPKKDEYFRFLNAGSWIAPIKTYKGFRGINRLFNGTLISEKINDQRYFTNIFLNSNDIVLDYNCILFQTLYNINKNYLIIENNKKLYNTYSDSYPCVLHGNGKIDMTEYINELI